MSRKIVFSVAAVSAFMLPSNEAMACAACSKAKALDGLVVSETGVATTEVRSATEAIKVGFDAMIAAIRSSTANITTELHKGSQVQKTMLDELNRQQEQRAKAEYVLESKQYYEDRYGEENIPMSACEDFVDAQSLKYAMEISAEELDTAIGNYFEEYRDAYPIDDWKYHQRTLEFSATKDVDMSKALFSQEDVNNAVELINQTIDPIPARPVKEVKNIDSLSADQRALVSKMQTINLRLDAPKHALKEQVLFKAPIVGEQGDEESVQSILEERAYTALDPEDLVDLMTGSSTVALKMLVRDQQYGLAMEYAAFQSNMNLARMQAIELAASMDKSRSAYRAVENRLDAKHAVSQ